MRILSAAFLVVMAVIFLAPWSLRNASAAWTQAPGESLVIIRLDGSQLQPELGAERRKLELATYVVYGFREGITLGLSARGEQLFPRKSENPRLTDLEPFVRIRLAAGDYWVISTETAVSLPVSKAAPHLSAPDEKWAVEAQLLGGIGGPVYGMQGFSVLGAGWRSRFGDGEDALEFQATLGLWPAGDLMLIGQSFFTLETGNPLPGVPPRRDVIKIQASAVYRLTPSLSLEIGGRRERALGGRGRARALFLGLWTRF